MNGCRCWSLPLLLAMAGLAWAGPAPTTPVPAKAEGLVQTLGSPSYHAREKAGRELLHMGRSAYSALQVGALDANPEIRFRCRQLLPRIYDLELKARIEAFLDDEDGKKAHDLPGWTRFRAQVGQDPMARNLYVEMLRADGRLMDAVESQPAFGAEKIMIRCSQLQPRFNQPPAGGALTRAEISQLLFLGTHPGVTLTPQYVVQVNQFLYRPELRTWITGSGGAGLFRKLMLAWLNRNIDDTNIGYLINNLAQTVQMKELLGPSAKIAQNAKAIPHVRANVMTVLGRLGDKEHMSILEPLIADPTTVQQFAFNRVKGVVQIGDVALAMCIHLSGQKPGDYGYEAIAQNPNWVHAYYYLGFETDEKRAAAKKKWQDWKSSQKAGPAKP